MVAGYLHDSLGKLANERQSHSQKTSPPTRCDLYELSVPLAGIISSPSMIQSGATL